MADGTRNRQSSPGKPSSLAMRAETMIWSAALPSITAVLWPSRRQPSGVRFAVVSTWPRSKTRRTFRMRERKNQRTVGNLGKNGLLLRLASAFGYKRRADHDGCKIGLRDQAAAERFHQDAGFDRAGAEPAIGLADRQRQPAEVGELFPDVGAETKRIAGNAAAVIGVIGPGDEAVDAFAQQALLVAQGKVHLNYFAIAGFLTEG